MFPERRNNFIKRSQEKYMKNYLFITKMFAIPVHLAFLAVIVLALVFTAKAQTTTFGQFTNDGVQEFVFTNNTSSATFGTVSGGAAVQFRYRNINGMLPPSLTGFQSAHLTLTSTTTQPATSATGNVTQPLNQTVTIAIIRDTPAPILTGTGSRTNLLTAVITTNSSPPDIVGTAGGQSATFSASTAPQNVTYSSDFINFTTTTQRNFSFSFSAVTPGINIGAGSFLQSFTADATGTFASDPPPTYTPPTAAAVVISGRVLSEGSSGLRGANVTLIEANGTPHYTTTGTFGNYEFPGIEAGQTVVISVNSKRYRYTSRIINLRDSIADFDIYPDL
jgi:hypothetical protein